MALKPPVPAGEKFEVTFKSSSQSAGTTLLTVGFVPKHGSPVPPVEDTTVAAGACDGISGVIPSRDAARRIEIRVDLPDGTGFGTLTFCINGTTHSEETLSRDTTWTSLVG